MRKYSAYFILCMCISILSAVCAYTLFGTNHPDACAVLCVVSFIAWYVGVMAPNEEKYTDMYNEYLEYKKKYG